MTNKVIVAQENRHLDYTDAERFGEVVFATNIEFSPMPKSLNNKTMLQDLQLGFKDFDPENDYLLMSGNPITMGYAFFLAYWACLEKGKPLNILKWDNAAGRYQPVIFSTED